MPVACHPVERRTANGMVVTISPASASVSGRSSALARRQSAKAISTMFRLSSTRQSQMLLVVTHSSASMMRRLLHVCQRLFRNDKKLWPLIATPRKFQSS